MENAGYVTLRDEYLPAAAGTLVLRVPLLGDPARDGACGSTTPRSPSLVGRPLAERVLRPDGRCCTPPSRRPSSTSRGPASPTRKSWATARTSCPAPTRWPRTTTTCRRSVNFDGITYTKGASILKQLVARVGLENFLSGLGEYFREHAYDSGEFADLLGALEGRRAASCRTGHEWLQTLGRQHASRRVHPRRRGGYASFAVEQTAAPDYPTLRRHRIGISLYDEVDDLLIRRSHVEVDIHGASTEIADLVGQQRRTAAAQRRRPDLRQGPPRRAVARHRRRRPVPARRLAGPGAVLGCGVGHDPRRGDERLRLRRPGAGQHRHRDRRVQREPDPRLRRPGGQQLLRAGQPSSAQGDTGAGAAQAARERAARR